MKILIIDDDNNELKKAQLSVEAKGWEAIVCNPTTEDNKRWMDLISLTDGVITDLLWVHRDDDGEKKPMGLLVVIHSLFIGKPVLICTDTQADNSHGDFGKAVSFIYEGYVMPIKLAEHGEPFGWEKNKDWQEAVERLSEQMANK
jgi:hypothetical protein